MKKSLSVFLLVLILIGTIFFISIKESFSSSGLSMSNEYCNKLVDIYYNPMHRKKANNKICDCCRKYMIDYETGNYFTENNYLI